MHCMPANSNGTVETCNTIQAPGRAGILKHGSDGKAMPMATRMEIRNRRRTEREA